MLESFSLVDKRQLLRNKVDWDNHFLLTMRKEPTHVVLNVRELGELSDEEKARLFSEIITYLYQ